MYATTAREPLSSAMVRRTLRVRMGAGDLTLRRVLAVCARRRYTVLAMSFAQRTAELELEADAALARGMELYLRALPDVEAVDAA